MIRWLIARYPAEWRRRYGDELVDLAEGAGRQPLLLLDLARGAFREHGRGLRDRLQAGGSLKLEPAWRHPKAWAALAAVILLPTLLLVVVSLLAYEVGIAELAAAVDPVLASVDAWPPATVYLALAPAIAALVAGLPVMRVEVRGGKTLIALRARAGNLAVAAVAIMVGLFLVAHILSEAVLEAGR